MMCDIGMEKKFELLLNAVERLSSEDPNLEPSLLFYADLLLLRDELSGSVREKIENPDKIVEKSKEIEGGEKPLTEITGIPTLDQATWRNIMAEVIEVVLKHRKGLSTELEKVKESLDGEDLDIRKLAESSLTEEPNYVKEVASKLDVEVDLIQALALWTVQPVFKAIRLLVEGKMDVNKWHNGFCPICGSYTRTGYIARDRGQFLKCEMCGMEWPFQMLTCPFCGNEDKRMIEIHQVDGGRFRLYICRVCSNYWKVVDEELVEESIPRDLYPVWTFKLDEMAEEILSEAQESKED
ncbi:MAG: formate dehydrogenase accessory protein FdhE [Candidatus Korarchaeota archaeon]|nr:formate dehydrogenase accessory protein FdhE [Candidatus Korarchaeota archaeon]